MKYKMLILAIFLFAIINFSYSYVESVSTIFPINNLQIQNPTVNFTFKAISNTSTTFSCGLYIDGNLVNSTNVTNDTVSGIKYNLSLGVHNWYINCSDANNSLNSTPLLVGIGSAFHRCAILYGNSSYYLDADIYSNVTSNSYKCIRFYSGNVSLDCRGHSISGVHAVSSHAIYITKNNVEVKNCIINNWSNGITVYGSSLNYLYNNSLINNTLYDNYLNPIYLFYSKNTTVEFNNIYNNSYAILLDHSSINNVSYNRIWNNEYKAIQLSYANNNLIWSNNIFNNGDDGIFISSSIGNNVSNNNLSSNFIGIELASNSNYLSGNTLVNNKYNFGVSSSVAPTNNVTKTNTINGKPIYYLVGVSNLTVPTNAGVVVLVNCNNITITNLSISNNLQNIYLYNVTNINIQNVSLNEGYTGLYSFLGSNLTILDSKIKSNLYGLSLYVSNGNITSSIVSNSFIGLDLVYSTLNCNHDVIELNDLDLNTSSSTFSCSNTTFYMNKNTTGVKILGIDVVSIGRNLSFDVKISSLTNASVNVFPYANLNWMYNSTDVYGNVSIDKSGVFSLIFNLTDSNNNKYIFYQHLYSMSNETYNDSVKYYLRPGIIPLHGQPNGPDARSVLFEPPTSAEIFSCNSWTQASPDELPVVIYGTIKNITISHWYTALGSPIVGITTNVVYNPTLIYSTAVPSSANLSHNVVTFRNVDWNMSTERDWYFLGFVLRGVYPHWFSSPSKRSFILINYTSNIPAIVNSLPKGLILYSETLTEDSKVGEIILDGKGIYTINVHMPLHGKYFVLYDGISCNQTTKCNYTENENEINVTAYFDSTHNITVVYSNPQVSFYCTPSEVVLGGEITCYCSAKNNVPYTTLSYPKHPSTGIVGTFNVSCTATDPVSSVTKYFVYKVFSPTNTENVNINSYSWWGTIYNNSSVCFNSSKTPIVCIEFKVNKPISNAYLSIKLQNYTITNYTTYSSFVIISNFEPEVAYISFKVSRGWIELHNLNRTFIHLFRYSNGSWIALPTSKFKEDSKYIYYKSESPGLSKFLIGVQRVNINKTTFVNNTNETINKTISESSVIKIEKNKLNENNLLVFVLVVFDLLFVLYLFRGKVKHK